MATLAQPSTMPSVTASPSEPALVLDGATKVFSSHGDPISRGVRSLLGRAPKEQKVVRAVDAVSFTVERGEVFGVLGSNGSGKSTLIRLISTLLLPDAGSIRVFGHDVERDEMAVKGLINRVSVDAAFFKKLSAWENLIYAARLYGMPRDEARERSIEILRQLGLKASRIDEPLEHMSRGMQQKVAIARAFLTSPVLVLLDEPTTGLDPRSKRDVQEFVENIRRTHDATMLLTTHDMPEADRLCDRLAIIDNGKIVAIDTPEALKARASTAGHAASLEDVFMEFTGRSLEDGDVEPEGEES